MASHRSSTPHPATVAGLSPKTTKELAAEAGMSERTYQQQVETFTRVNAHVGITSYDHHIPRFFSLAANS